MQNKSMPSKAVASGEVSLKQNVGANNKKIG